MDPQSSKLCSRVTVLQWVMVQQQRQQGEVKLSVRGIKIFNKETSKHNKKWKEQYWEPLCAKLATFSNYQLINTVSSIPFPLFLLSNPFVNRLKQIPDIRSFYLQHFSVAPAQFLEEQPKESLRYLLKAQAKLTSRQAAHRSVYTTTD